MASSQTETTLDIPCVEGFTLSATFHTAGDSPLGAILICPAMGVTSRFYASYARFLCYEGFDVLRIDYRGMGASQTEPLRDCPATMQSWAEADIATALRWIKRKKPGVPVAVVGHSAGGQLSCLSSPDIPPDALLLVASQSGYWRHWSGIKQVPMFLLWYVLIPVMTRLFGRFPARMLKLGEDLPRGVALQWANWGRSIGYITSDAVLAERYSNYTGPVLAYSFTDDEFAPAKAVKAFLSYFTSAVIDHRVISPQNLSLKKIGHFGFFREWIGKEFLWKDSSDWLKSTLV